MHVNKQQKVLPQSQRPAQLANKSSPSAPCLRVDAAGNHTLLSPGGVEDVCQRKPQTCASRRGGHLRQRLECAPDKVTNE
jgi:hypothetical protein